MGSLLFLAPNLPLPKLGGGSLRMYHLIQYLGQRFDVDLILPAYPGVEEAETVCRAWCAEVECVVPSVSQSVKRHFRWGPYEIDPALKNAIHRRLKEKSYGAVHVEKPAMLPYLPKNVRLPIILDTWAYGLSGPIRALRNQAGLFKRCRNLVQMTRFVLFDAFCWPNTYCILVVSQEDRVRCERAHPKARVMVVPNGVDCDVVKPKSISKLEPRHIVFSGDMSFPPNVDAAHLLAAKIFPEIQHHHPDAKLFLVGRKPVASIRQLQASGIIVTGEVKNMVSYLHRASVYVAPHFTGAGTRTKLLEAMAAGLPIVTTSIGIEGITAVDQQEVVIADTVLDLQAAILSLLENPAERLRLGVAARLLVEQQYDWRKCLQPLKELYADIVLRKEVPC